LQSYPRYFLRTMCGPSCLCLHRGGSPEHRTTLDVIHMQAQKRSQATRRSRTSAPSWHRSEPEARGSLGGLKPGAHGGEGGRRRAHEEARVGRQCGDFLQFTQEEPSQATKSVIWDIFHEHAGATPVLVAIMIWVAFVSLSGRNIILPEGPGVRNKGNEMHKL
jgi:hypothetical protein